LKVRLLSLFAAVTSLLSAGCGGNKTLSGGYVLKYMNGCEVRIYNPQIDESVKPKKTLGKACGSTVSAISLSGTMINGNIESYAVREPFITGFASKKCLDERVEAVCEGYFLLNSQTHEISVGLSEEEWKLHLQRIGWSNPTLNSLRKSS
jgi:hypothetical protein